MFASIEIVSRWMPKKVSDVVGPSTLNGLIGALSVLHSVNMAWRFRSQVSELAEPAVKNHLSSEANALHHNYVKGFSAKHLKNG